MRLRNKTNASVLRFTFERSPKAPTPSPAAPPLRAADLDNPYGRYYSQPRTREQLLEQRKKNQ